MHTITLLDWQREASINLFVKIQSALGFYPQLSLNTLPENDNMLTILQLLAQMELKLGPSRTGLG